MVKFFLQAKVIILTADKQDVSKELKIVHSLPWVEMPDWLPAVAQALLTALRERDPYSYGHCRRVSRSARLLAKAAGFNEDEQRVIEYSALFHDLGKLGIPDSILLKTGRLNPEEEKIMQEHPLRSVEVLQPLSHIPFFRATFAGIRHHHERIDGKGYPDGLVGDQIPMIARVILVVDTFDAMTTNRPYRKKLPLDVAYGELKNFAGRQFDEQFVKIFIESHKHWGQMEDEITEEFVSQRFKRAA